MTVELSSVILSSMVRFEKQLKYEDVTRGLSREIGRRVTRRGEVYQVSEEEGERREREKEVC